jgi:hypothetical protein
VPTTPTPIRLDSILPPYYAATRIARDHLIAVSIDGALIMRPSTPDDILAQLDRINMRVVFDYEAA